MLEGLLAALMTWSADNVSLKDDRGQAWLEIGHAQVLTMWPPRVHVDRLAVTVQGVKLEVPGGELSTDNTSNARLAAPAARLTSPASIDMKDLDVTFARDGSAVAIQGFRAGVFGGKASGAVKGRAHLVLDAISLAQAAGRKGKETLDAELDLDLAPSIAGLAGSGRATLHGLSTDLRHDPTLNSMSAQVNAGARKAAQFNALTALIPDENIRGMASSMGGGNQVAYYRGIIAGLRKVHDLGSVSGPVKIEKGVATIAPFTGPKLQGNVSLDLASAHVKGHCSRVRLGRVTLLDVSLSGTISDPSYGVNKNRVLVDGHGVSTHPRGGVSMPDVGRALAPRLRGNPAGLLRGVLGGKLPGF